MAGEVVKPKIYSCMGCGASLTVSAAGYTTTVVCGACGSISDVNSALPRLIGTFSKNKKYDPVFVLGSFATLKGIKWKLIGFVVRQEPSSKFTWEEYLLYNPYYGYRWLLNIDGHFSLTKRLPDVPLTVDPNNSASSFNYNGDSYKLYNAGRAKVLYVVGEFYWRVKQGETVDMWDYISPPRMISVEMIDRFETNYSISEYLSTDEIKSSMTFVHPEKGVHPYGVAANQPNPHLFSKSTVFMMIAGVVALSFLNFSIDKVKSESLVFGDTFDSSTRPQPPPNPIFFGLQPNPSPPAAPTGTESKTKISPSFEIRDEIGNLEVEMFSPVSNQWAESSITLVNEATGEDFSMEQGVEYYFGSDSDGPWSEGSQRSTKIISEVPGGVYHMEVEVSGSQPENTAMLKVYRNASMTSNFVLAILLILLPGVFKFFRSQAFEQKRWANSDYNPFNQYSDDDDE